MCYDREARTILLLHIISVRPSKQPLMVRTFLKVMRCLLFVLAYMELGSSFWFLQEQIKDIIIIMRECPSSRREAGRHQIVDVEDNEPGLHQIVDVEDNELSKASEPLQPCSAEIAVPGHADIVHTTAG